MRTTKENLNRGTIHATYWVRQNCASVCHLLCSLEKWSILTKNFDQKALNLPLVFEHFLQALATYCVLLEKLSIITKKFDEKTSNFLLVFEQFPFWTNHGRIILKTIRQLLSAFQATIPSRLLCETNHLFRVSLAYMISAEQRAIETIASVDISHSGICLNTPYSLRSAAPS